MNRHILIILFCTPFFGFSQVSFTSWVNSYLQINSYNGNTNSDAYTVTFAGNGNLNVPHWKLSARLKQNIVSEDGKFTIPSNKISFQPISTTGQAYPNPVPTISQIGAPLNVFLQDNSESFLIPNSNAPIYNNPQTPNGYYNLQLKYALTLLGGSYLGSFPAWTRFIAPIEFTAYDQNNVIIGKMSHDFQFQIGNITDAPPPADILSLKINTNAANGLLEFKTMQDYNNGTSVTYTDGLSVTTNSNFQIKVRSLQSNLQSAAGNSIPVEVINLTLVPATSNASQRIFPIVLSAANQTLVQGNSTNNMPYRFDIKYFTLPQDIRLIDAKSDNYTTTLQYEITPQ
ncbi:hypothetical protein B0A67_05205 [Flavobacterium aquidurense]|uniref:hypothetical protein n=1 Tax=Flavobacterium aquidurense TaxID=362413 RepID=UPI0009123D9F|nr:hypothetical protein [Flavobacterium aquidurense]OXA73073.1 hypothetical protein B0A67_05205 [Flavobacterium aquidurense]SHG17172.1 hypothetical protein SAMN05444481_102400 [Flavobacterium frigidimaris]